MAIDKDPVRGWLWSIEYFTEPGGTLDVSMLQHFGSRLELPPPSQGGRDL